MAVTVTISNAQTVADFSQGLSAIAGQGTLWQIAFGGTWLVGDSFTCQLITASQTFDFGTGRCYGNTPTSAYTLADRVHFVSGTYWFGSDNGDCTGWEQQAPGSFKINVANQSQQNENLICLSAFQGRMAVASRNTITVWALDADPTKISLLQTISNMGCVSPQGMQSLGDFDVLFPNDTGIRSLRVLAINLNGFITDIGAPVDSDIQALVQGQTTTELANICSVVDPVSKRYWVYFPSLGKIYCLSYFSTAKIIAWSTFIPAISAVSGISISQFRVYNSIIYFLGTTNTVGALPINQTYFIGTYGTPDGNPTYDYDATQPIITFPWLDLKNPGTRKQAKSIDIVVQGQWTINGSMDFNGVNKGAALHNIVTNVNPNPTPTVSTVYASAQHGLIPWTDDGFHVQLQAIGTSNNFPDAIAKFSEMVFYFTGGQEK